MPQSRTLKKFRVSYQERIQGNTCHPCHHSVSIHAPLLVPYTATWLGEPTRRVIKSAPNPVPMTHKISNGIIHSGNWQDFLSELTHSQQRNTFYYNTSMEYMENHSPRFSDDSTVSTSCGHQVSHNTRTKEATPHCLQHHQNCRKTQFQLSLKN